MYLFFEGSSPDFAWQSDTEFSSQFHRGPVDLKQIFSLFMTPLEATTVVDARTCIT